MIHASFQLFYSRSEVAYACAYALAISVPLLLLLTLWVRRSRRRVTATMPGAPSESTGARTTTSIPKPLPDAPTSRGLSIPLGRDNEELMLPPDGVLLDRMGSLIHAVKFQVTLKCTERAVNQETAVLTAIKARRKVAMELAKERRSDERAARYEEQIETARLDAELMELRCKRVEHERRAYAFEHDHAKQKALLDFEIRAEQRKFEPPPAPSVEDPVEAEIRKIAAQFAIFQRSMQEGVRLHQAIEELRGDLTARFGAERSEEILNRALEMSGLGGEPEVDPDWFTRGQGKARKP